MKKALSVILSILMIITTLSALPFSANANTTLINEGFENGIPNDWTTENSNPDNTYWNADRAGDYSLEPGAHSGDKNAYAKHIATSDYSYLITPAVDLSNASLAYFSFWYINRDWGGDVDKLEVFYRVNGGEWIELLHMADGESTSTWTEWSNMLPSAALAKNVQFGFKYTDKYGYGVGLDDVKLTTDYYDGELGAIYTPEATTFNYWAPDATSVNLDIVMSVQQPMQKLMVNEKWTGVWTITLSGNYLDYRYHFVVDGKGKLDPYGKANNAYYGTTVTSPNATNPSDWDSDSHIFFDDGESSGVMSYIDVGSFSSNTNSGIRADYSGKYLGLLEQGSTVNNEGSIPTGNGFLHHYSDIDSVCLDIASSDNLMLPEKEYAYDTWTEGASVKEVKQMIQALHNIGLAVNLSLDFSDAPFTGDMLRKYIIDTCTYWANEYHIDGFILEKMISPENETALKAALENIDTRFFLAGTTTNRLIKDDWLISVDETLPTVSPIPAYFINGMSSRTSLYNRYTLNMSDLQMTIAAMCRGRLALKLGQEFGGFGASVDWSKLGSSCDPETGEPVFDHSYSYFRKLVEIRKAFAPLYSAKGTQQVKSSGNTVECNYTNAAEHEGEWEKLKVLVNLYSNNRSFTNTDNWVVIANEGEVDYYNGLGVINGTNISVPAKTAMILVDKASFDKINAISYGFSVCGTDVTTANAEDVFGDGTVSFNPETNTLTLNNANITTSDTFIYSINRDLNIELIGNNNITVTGYSNGIVFNRGAEESAKLSFTGSGTLNLGSASGKGIDLRGTMIVDGPSVNVHSAGIAISTTENSDIIVDSGSLNIKSDENYGIFNYVFGDNKGSIEVNGGTLTVESALGGTNIDDISFSGVEYNEGTDLSQSGKVSVGKHIHHTTKVPAKAATAEKAGNKEYYTCTCGKMFEDSQGTKEITEIPLVEFVHTLKKIPAKAATTEKEGNKEYYVCTCGKLYEDAAGTKEIKDSKSVVIPKIVLPPADAKLPTEKKTENTIKKTNTDKNDVSGAQIKQLMLKATAKNQTITLSWKKINGAQGYIIYGGPCGKDMKRLATVKNGKTVKKTFKKLKKGKYYKYMVVAYKKTADGNNRVICKSKSVHCCTDGGKKGNPTSISVKKAKLTVKKGKTVKIQPTLKIKKKVDTHIAKFRYESSNTKIATVDKNGKVKGVKKGTATIYVYAQDGKCKTVKITVK